MSLNTFFTKYQSILFNDFILTFATRKVQRDSTIMNISGINLNKTKLRSEYCIFISNYNESITDGRAWATSIQHNNQ